MEKYKIKMWKMSLILIGQLTDALARKLLFTIYSTIYTVVTRVPFQLISMVGRQQMNIMD